MLYSVKMKYFDKDGDCYGVIDGQFPSFSLAWEMVNMIKPENDKVTKFYRMDSVKEDEDNEYFRYTNITYTTCDGARRALKRYPKDNEGNYRLVLYAGWNSDDLNEEAHVLIIMKAEAKKDF